MAVVVEVPGIGPVIANNAAQDSTLQAILAVLKAQTDAAGIDTSGIKALNAQSGRTAGSLGKLQGNFGSLDASVQNTSSSFAMATRSMSNLMSSMTKSASTITSGMGESMERSLGEVSRLTQTAGKTLGSVFGGLGSFVGGAVTGAFGLVTGAMAKQADAYNTAAQAGFNFGYSMDNMRNISNAAGLSMTQLTKVMQQSANSMALFGGGTNQGAREFARLNKIVRDQSGPTMLRMGIGFEEQGVRTAETIERLMLAGMSFDEVARSGDLIARETFKRAQVEGQLAKINGTTLQQEREKMKAAQKDVTLQATLFGAGEKERTQMESLYKQLEGQFGPGMAKLALEIYKSGGAMSEAGSLLTMQMPGLTGALTEQIGDIKRTGGETSRTYGDMIAGLDPEALRRERGAMAELASTASLAGVNMGTLSTVIEQSFIGLQRLATQVESGTIDRILADQEKIFEDAGKVTAGMVNIADKIQKASVQLATAMTDIIGSDVGRSVLAFNTQAVELFATGATNLRGFTSGLQDAIDRLKKFANTGEVPTEPEQRMFGSLGVTGKLMEDFGQGTLAMLHGREAVITEKQMSNMFTNVNAFREGTLAGLADQMSKFGGAVTENAAIAQAEMQSGPVSTSNVVSLSNPDKELLMQIAQGNQMVADTVKTAGNYTVEVLEEVKMNTG